MFSSSLHNRLSVLSDPRLRRCRRYPLVDVLLIVLCGLLCGMNTFVGIAEWATAKKDWLHECLDIAAVPSHDTIGRILATIDPLALNACLLQWSQALWKDSKGKAAESAEAEVVAFDGKVIRGALGSLNLMSAFATVARLTLAVQKVPEGSNEIPALPQLLTETLKLLALEGTIVTADAIHCQVNTAQAILSKKADYLLALKKNQEDLFETAQYYFDFLRKEAFAPDGRLVAYDFCHTIEKAHGQIESRRCYVLPNTGWIDPFHTWPKLRSVIQVERECDKAGKTTRETRYFLSSLEGGKRSARRALRAVRRHWRIENSQHWMLDVVFREDHSRVRKDKAPQNLSILRRLALNLLRQEKTANGGIEIKRHRAGWDSGYLEKLLATN